MGAEIDESKRKPRRTRGTPSYYYRNKFAFGVIALGCTLFAAFAQTPIFKVANEKLKNRFMYRTEEEIARRELFSFTPQRTSEDILKILEQAEEIRKER